MPTSVRESFTPSQNNQLHYNTVYCNQTFRILQIIVMYGKKNSETKWHYYNPTWFEFFTFYPCTCRIFVNRKSGANCATTNTKAACVSETSVSTPDHTVYTTPYTTVWTSHILSIGRVKQSKYIVTSVGEFRMTQVRQMFLFRTVEQPCKVRSDTKGMSGASSPKTTAHCPLVWYRIPFLVPRPDSTEHAAHPASFIHSDLLPCSAPLGNSSYCHLSAQRRTT